MIVARYEQDPAAPSSELRHGSNHRRDARRYDDLEVHRREINVRPCPGFRLIARFALDTFGRCGGRASALQVETPLGRC
jgi:hypothetical protein